MSALVTIVTIVAGVVLIVGYLCLAIKAGFIVSDLTEDSGFYAGFNLMTVFGVLALPLAIAFAVLS